MKTFFKRNFSKMVVALAVVFAMAIQPFAVHAEASSDDVATKVAAAEAAVAELAESSATELLAVPTAIEPRAHVSYYPSSGVSSGVFYGAYSGNCPVYNNLPANKTLYFSYSVSGGGTCYLQFYRGNSTSGTPYQSFTLTADDTAHESYITLPTSGTYTVEVYVPNSKSTTEHIYAFNLYTK